MRNRNNTNSETVQKTVITENKRLDLIKFNREFYTNYPHCTDEDKEQINDILEHTTKRAFKYCLTLKNMFDIAVIVNNSNPIYSISQIMNTIDNQYTVSIYTLIRF